VRAADAEVIVVGGGPAGASTASFLARAGCDVLVVDRARFPRDKPCAEYLSPEAGRVLAAMGVLEALERCDVARLNGMRIRAPDGTDIVGSFVAPHGFRGFRDHGLAVRRTVLDALLLEQARRTGARVLEGTQVLDLSRDGRGRVDGIVCRGENGSTTVRRAAVVVGADGLRSIVARRAGLGRLGRWPRRMALVTHYRGASDPPPGGEMHVFAGGYAGIAPVGRDLVNVALVVSVGEARAMAGNAAAFLDRRLVAAPGIAGRLTTAERAGPVAAVGPFNWRARTAWAPGVALVGDAADFFDPFTGEGIYTALRGGELLAPFALEASRARTPADAKAAGAAYDVARRSAFGGKWAVERAVGAAVAVPAVINFAARGLAARRDLADLLVGVTGDFVPARQVLRARYLAALIGAALGTAGR
jgi:flavin-dependent dehydrogenase